MFKNVDHIEEALHARQDVIHPVALISATVMAALYVLKFAHSTTYLMKIGEIYYVAIAGLRICLNF